MFAMFRRSVTIRRPQLHLPLGRLAMCLDCEKCFEIDGVTACPACGSETWVALARFLGRGPAVAVFS